MKIKAIRAGNFLLQIIPQAENIWPINKYTDDEFYPKTRNMINSKTFYH